MARRYPQHQVSQKRARVALSALLYGCTDERLAGFTAAHLAATHNVPAADVETMLAEARRSRGL